MQQRTTTAVFTLETTLPPVVHFLTTQTEVDDLCLTYDIPRNLDVELQEAVKQSPCFFIFVPKDVSTADRLKTVSSLLVKWKEDAFNRNHLGLFENPLQIVSFFSQGIKQYRHEEEKQATLPRLFASRVLQPA